MELFIHELTQPLESDLANAQFARDLQLVRRLAEIWGGRLSNSLSLLNNRLKDLQAGFHPSFKIRVNDPGAVHREARRGCC
jgi:hypothetical protein